MSLMVYRSSKDVPDTLKIIACNDSFFNTHTLLQDTVETQKVLQSIDEVSYFDANRVSVDRDKEGTIIYSKLLSTGCKTVLNIMYNPKSYCFDVIECGDNALRHIAQFTEGNILWREGIFTVPDGMACDMIIDDTHFTDMSEAINYLYKGA